MQGTRGSSYLTAVCHGFVAGRNQLTGNILERPSYSNTICTYPWLMLDFARGGALVVFEVHGPFGIDMGDEL